ncbi:hypothetical protein [Actinoallomurus iriomotensis]|uniref:Uncharacterized protein n=1 Tax=Actinoallomurus iriomotensis TaxID=478107 RepID=A0A9W6RSP1_9ACTN|nr:hypothetical protein [Actinoallomurus iriomotensis]GLY79210.1 hypothetical protein Airi01_074770 [Actinoallomurus iriomotensis]
MAGTEHTPHDPSTTPTTARAGGQRRTRRRRRVHRDAASSLGMVVTSFRALTTGPQPLSVDGKTIGHGLPRRVIRLDELRSILCHPATGRACRDAAWRHLVDAARTKGPSWVVGAAGVGMPALRKMASELSEGYRGDATDIHSAVLAGFLEGLVRIDLDRPGVITRLRWMAYRAGIKARYTREGIPVMPLPPLESQPPPPPWGHPDLILFDAVAKGVLSPVQAELIGRSRLENLTLKQAAAELGLGYEAARKARQRGEARLTAAMASGDVEHRLSPPAAVSGLPSARGQNPEPGVRGRSIPSDGTSERPTPDEKGAFCGPAHHLPHPKERPSSSPGSPANALSGSESGRDLAEPPGREGDTS